MDSLHLELHQLIRRYADIRIARPHRDARLVASLTEHGQSMPVLVCALEKDADPNQGADARLERYVLIDGYRRVRALEVLGRDTVRAMRTTLGESEALLWHHQMEARGRRSALEEGWLLHQLLAVRGMSREELASNMARSKSWLSGRLALVEILPESVQALVRRGELCAYAAQKYLVPIARESCDECEALAKKLSSCGLSTRDIRRIYIAWRDGDSGQRQRIVEHPGIFAAAANELESQPVDYTDLYWAPITSAQAIESDDQLSRALDELTALSSCICRGLARRDPQVQPNELLQAAWSRARTSVTTTAHYLEERAHAGQ